MNIIIPMAGEGSRFKQAGYTLPKPLIDVNGHHMIEWVIKGLPKNANFIFLVRKEHEDLYNISFILKNLVSNCRIVYVDKLTEGAACTTLLADNLITIDPLLIINSDQYIEWNNNIHLVNEDFDALIYVFKSTDPKFSFAKVNDKGWVTEVAEKIPISNNATCGAYFWKDGRTYVHFAKQMIKKNIRVNNEFYVCPVYNEAILAKYKVIVEDVKAMHCLGTPEQLNEFLKLGIKL